MPQLPTTAAYIGYHAARHPQDMALIFNGKGVTYDRFHLDIGRMVAALRRFELEPGRTAGIEVPHGYLHWLMILAFETLGVATYSHGTQEPHFGEDTLDTIDLVMHSPDRTPRHAKRLQLVDEKWIDAVLSLQPEIPFDAVTIAPHAPLRIVKGSGTTGNFKWMVHTRQVHEFWIDQYLVRTGFNRHSRFLISAGFHIQTYHAYASACIRMGGICIFDNQRVAAETLAQYAITHVTLAPYVLMLVLDDLADSYEKAPDLTVFTVGAPASKAIRDRVKRTLANDLVESYGTNEVAAICTMGDDGVGTVLPGVRVEVVDDGDKPVMNEAGRVRVKSGGLVSGYINNPDATRRMFRDGWFYPGDEGVMLDEHTLELIGRADDLLNIRGIKFAPLELEEKLIRELPVKDLCLTTLPDSEGVSQAWVALVPEDRTGIADIHEMLTSRLPGFFHHAKMTILPEIPRTNTGKVRRNELKRILRRARM